MRKKMLAAGLIAIALSSHVPAADAGYWSYVKCNFGRWTELHAGLQGRFGLAGAWWGDALMASPYSAYVAWTCLN